MKYRCPDGEELDMIRLEYPIGSRITLLNMQADNAPLKNSRGIVRKVFDVGAVLVDWTHPNGTKTTRAFIPGVDQVKKLPIAVFFNNEISYWANVDRAKRHYQKLYEKECDPGKKRKIRRILDGLEQNVDYCIDETPSPRIQKMLEEMKK